MDPLLVVVTVMSLVLGAAMSLVAWKLLRQQRSRSAARVEALQAMSADAGDVADAAAPRSAERFATLEDASIDVVRAPAPAAAASRLAPIQDVAMALAPAPRPPRESGGDPAWDAMRGRDRAHSTRPATEIPVHFGAVIEPPAPGRRWVALAAVAAVMTTGFVTVYALYSTDISGMFSRAFTASASPATAEPLQLLSLKHTTDEAGTFVLTGLVQNPPSGRPLRGVVAVVYLFDQDGRYFAGGKMPLDLPSVHPGEESPFVVKVQGAAGVARYRIGFRFDGGGVVAHVDRRGQLPDGTVEDAVEDGSRVVAPALPRRSEG